MQRLELCSLLAPGKGLASWDANKSPKTCLSPKQLEGSASTPSTRNLDVVINLPDGSGYADIIVDIDATRGTVTVGDVLNALYVELQKQVDMKAWQTKAANFQSIMASAAGKPEFKGVPRVVDLFLKETRFSGLAFDEGTKTWRASFTG
ncbi:hypothetical protein AURDEDRAFT_112099 [Auricularia subglabra TFB-10046 SS5]|nr:hypothetical protein AURDEDRAFT_112099 [Auricularia subglabra TFB-10046 SS5]